ncbi:hypothetical protein O181_050014 [Austropuccinia psidii MF-1]|uniref:SH3 domain-containing protein n=1 Tax=Austropuccinia psidii MF-1 TaxID=1389203 RepID=A0A9Q3DW20_9BASI|nr:hypothetical protein [Austropuccinia psidii MF-1]
MRIANPLPTSLPLEVRKANKIFKSFANPTTPLDGLIPSHVLKSAYGFAIFSVLKAGFVMSLRAGTGIVIARLSTGHWSAPSAIGIGGMGFGGQIGAEVAEFILVLNSKAALRQFMSAGSITLGGNASVALGPIGRNAEGSGSLNSKGKLAAMYSYSKTKGAFAGISLEGSLIFERQDCNTKTYGNHVTSTQILSGQIDPPPWANELLETLSIRTGNFTQYVNKPSSASFSDLTLNNQPFPSSSTNPFQLESPHSVNQFGQPSPTRLGPPVCSPEHYSFGSSNPLASRVSSPAPKHKTKQSFNLSPWRKNSDRKNRSLNQTSRTAPVPDWAQSHIFPTNLNQEPFVKPINSWFPEQISEASDKNIEGKSFQHLNKKHEDDQLSLSSIGTDLDDLSDSLKSYIDSHSVPKALSYRASLGNDKSPPIQPKLSKSTCSTNVPQTLTDSDGNQTSGFIDDLISFDQIPSFGPSDLFQSSSTVLTSQPKPHASDNSSDILYNDTTFGLVPDNSCNGGKTRLQTISSKTSNSEDFLVGMRMPSVVGTKVGVARFLGQAVAVYDFKSSEPGDLSFKKGDSINILEKVDQDWLLGSIGLRRGIFPLNRVKIEKN